MSTASKKKVPVPEMDEGQKWLWLDLVAEKLKVCERTVYNYILAGILPNARRRYDSVRHRVRWQIPESDLKEYPSKIEKRDADLTELHRELMLRNRKSPPKGIRPLWADKRSKNPSPSSHAKPSSGKKN